MSAQSQCIADLQQRRSVDKDDIGTLSQLREDLAQVRLADEVADIRRRESGREDLKPTFAFVTGLSVPLVAERHARKRVAQSRISERDIGETWAGG